MAVWITPTRWCISKNTQTSSGVFQGFKSFLIASRLITRVLCGRSMLRSTAIVIGIVGLPMIWVGAELALMGGTPYYLAAGSLMTFSAMDLWRKQKRGFYVFMGVLLLTLVWAVYEAQFEFWLVGSRIWLIGLSLIHI